MSCQSCNSAKNDQLPSEWLGESCPASVLLIEIREHDRLRKDFSCRRDSKSESVKASLFAFNLNNEDEVEYAGEVLSESPTIIRIKAFSALTGFMTGAIYDVPRDRCFLFTDVESMDHALSIRFSQEDRKHGRRLAQRQ